MNVLYHLVRADFLERVRRYSFLIVLGATICLGYTVAAGHLVLRLGDYTGVYNSTWVGFLMTGTTTFFLSLAGFYIVKDTLERDRRTGVGQIIATTPVGKLFYIMGKTLSNLTVFLVILGILLLAAVVAQLVRGEELRIELWPLISPCLMISLPAMVFLAAVAVLFETLPWLRGGLGNVAYFFLWALVFVIRTATHPTPFVDLTGVNSITKVFNGAARARGLDYTDGFSIEPGGLASAQSVHWEDISWTSEIVWGRLYWVGVAFALMLAAVVLFDRFDPARGIFHRYDLSFQRARRGLLGRWQKGSSPDTTPSVALEAKGLVPAPERVSLTPLAVAATKGHSTLRPYFGRVLLAELRLMLKRQRWWWYAVAVGLIVAGLLSTGRKARETWLPLSWVWPVLVWSAMGVREARHRTEQLVFSTAHPLCRQLPATWLAGVIVTLLAGGGVAVRLLLAGEWVTLLAWAVGALFIPTLALALGVWSGSSKPFEAAYVAWWYIGPINQTSALDFMGALNGSVAAGVPWYYLALTVILLGLAVAGRRRQLQM